MTNITKIEFFPDYISDGVWITREGENSHCAATLQELEDELDITIPQWFKNKLDAAQAFYDMFEPTHYDDHIDRYGQYFTIDWDLVEHILVSDFKREFPKYAHLIHYSGGHSLNRYS